MIKTPTVLVLGAGASKTYGFPTGAELLVEIWQSIRNDWMAEVHRNDVVTKRALDQFGDLLRGSLQSSIDAFLERRADLRDLGKKTIARVLIPKENEGELSARPHESWYHYLFKAMNTDAHTLEDFGENRISFINYNYDRSLRHSLSNALCSNYHKNPAEVRPMLDRFPIIHPHGCLSPYDPDGSLGGRAYRPEVTHENVAAAASYIQIIHEGKDDTPELVKARELLQQAERIGFIGFGYDPINVRRLRTQDWCDRNIRRIEGTGYGLGINDYNSAISLFRGNVDIHQDCTALDFLRNRFSLT